MSPLILESRYVETLTLTDLLLISFESHTSEASPLQNSVFGSNQVKSSEVELYCHPATCVDIQWNEMSCLTGPRCYMNTDL